MLAARPEACIWLGFRPGITPERFRALIEQQDTAGLLDCLHRVPIRPGEVYFIPAGTVHAMGSGSLVAEIQEPVDITLRAECVRPDGSRLPVESMYGPAGMDGPAGLLHLRLPAPGGHAVRPSVPAGGGARPALARRLISRRQTGRFYMDEVTAEGAAIPCPNPDFQVLLVLEGEGTLRWEGGSLSVKRGDELFVPHGVASYRLESAGRCRPAGVRRAGGGLGDGAAESGAAAALARRHPGGESEKGLRPAAEPGPWGRISPCSPRCGATATASMAARRRCGRGEAVPAGGDFVRAFQALAAELGMAIGVTFLEAHRGGPRNTLTLFDRFGREALTYARSTPATSGRSGT